MLLRSFDFVQSGTRVGSGLNNVTRHIAAQSHRNGVPLTGLEEIGDIAAIARDVLIVLVCIVAIVLQLVIIVRVRKMAGRIDKAMDHIEDLIASCVSARDSIVEFRDRVKSRTSSGSGNGGGGFNAVSWLLSPLGHAISQQFRKRRARDDG